MSSKAFLTRIQMKRDISSNWVANDPVLLDGEMVIVDTDAGEVRYKVGDGEKRFTQLPFTDEIMRNLVNNKQDKLTIDATPISDSSNPVASGGVKEYFDALSERIIQSDFEQNDTTAIDYVKNRTHWVQRAEVILNAEMFECTTQATDSDSYYCVKSGNIGLVNGNKYKVTVNGTEYVASALGSFGSDDIALLAEAEKCRIYDRSNGTVEVFTDSSTTLTISIEDAEDIYVKLDERFIPDVFARLDDVALKMDRENPTGSGALSMNRASGSAIGENSVAIGTDCIASGASAIAIGSGASATGFSSHAEGTDTVASGDLSHAEGQASKATGYASHAECSGEANGNYSHASGYGIADGDYSHASGNGTWAVGRSQTVIGEANIEDVAENAATRGTYAVIVGNGDMDAGEFSNAATLDWNGTAWFAGSVKVGGTEQNDVGAKELATQEHVQEQLTVFENRILPRMTKIILPVSGWDTNALTQTATVNGISEDETAQLVTVRPIGDSISPAIEAGVYCKSQGENQLTFSCLIQPIYDIDCMVTWQNVVYIPPTHTVTFYNDDGSSELYSYEINTGSDAIYVGDIPTKDSDGVYDYSFIGWSLTIGGDIDESALVNVVADRSVYAVFEKTEIEVVSGEWVPFCADGTTWMGEQVTEAQINTKPVIITDVVLSETNQYRLTVDGTEYICARSEESDGYSISCDECSVVIKYNQSLGGWYFADDDSDTRFSGTLKVESWTGSEPYVPEEEGYVPTDGYQAFTTDGTWTGEEVTTAVSVPDFTEYSTSFLPADIRWNGAPSATISNGTVVLIWVDNVCYTCSATVVGNPKSIYYFTCDGCPAAVMGGLGVGNNNWRVAFTAAGTYALKVEIAVP